MKYEVKKVSCDKMKMEKSQRYHYDSYYWELEPLQSPLQYPAAVHWMDNYRNTKEFLAAKELIIHLLFPTVQYFSPVINNFFCPLSYSYLLTIVNSTCVFMKACTVSVYTDEIVGEYWK